MTVLQISPSHKKKDEKSYSQRGRDKTLDKKKKKK
jgi:hypothetical protein